MCVLSIFLLFGRWISNKLQKQPLKAASGNVIHLHEVIFSILFFMVFFHYLLSPLYSCPLPLHPMSMIFYKIYVSGQCFTKYNVFYYTVAHNIVQVETGADLDEIGKSEGCSGVNALYLECKCHVGLYRSIASVPTTIHVLSGG